MDFCAQGALAIFSRLSYMLKSYSSSSWVSLSKESAAFSAYRPDILENGNILPLSI
jgi:hypothetical protein